MDKKEMIRRASSIALDENGNLKPILQQYEEYLAGKFKSHDLMILKLNSKGFNYLGINEDLIMVMRQSVIEKITRLPTPNKHGHGDTIDFDIIDKIFNTNVEILYAIKNAYDNYAFVINKKANDNNYILISINHSKDIGRGFEVNDITSIYGKKDLNNYIEFCRENNYTIKKINARYLEYNS